MEQQRTRIYGADVKAMLEMPVALLIAPVKESLVAEVTAQCEKAGLRAVLWADLNAAPPLAGKSPTLLVAELPPGERRIPDQVVSLMNHTFSDAPLLLVCSDVLHRPAISLQNGRVTLVGPPASPPRLLGRMRALLAGRIPTKRAHLETSELVNARWWVGALSPSGVAVPPLRQQVAEGVTALLPAAGARVGDDDLAKALTILRRGQASAEEHAQSLGALLGTRAGLVHLSSTAETWTFYWPDLPGQLVLGSTQRFPHQWDLAAALHRTGQKFARLGAAGGDTVVATTAALPSVGLVEAMADGGPAVLDLLNDHFARAQASFCGVVSEVR